MRISRTLFLVILMVSLSLALSASGILRYLASSDLPNARSQQTRSHIPDGTSITPSVNGVPTTEPTLGITQLEIHLSKISHVLDDPCPQWYIPFLNAGWAESEWDTAKWIIYRESRCLQDAFNGHDAGLLQINQIHTERVESYGLRFPEDLFDGETNLWVAHTLWMDYGWKPWVYKGVVPGA